MKDWLPWVVAFIPLTVSLVAAATAWKKHRDDRKAGVAANEVAEENAEANRWQSIIETQTKALLEPMQAQLREHAEKIRGLEEELANRNKKYWQAISLIRALYLWIDRHAPYNPDQQPLPKPTDLITEDI
jgi:hypothetical protein